MAKKKVKRKKAKTKTTKKSEERTAVIYVIFTESSLLEVVRAVGTTEAVYGESCLADTVAMSKILKALRQGDVRVVI